MTNQTPNHSKNIIIVASGTTAIETAQMYRALLFQYGFGIEQSAKIIAFDAQDIEHCKILPTVDKSLRDMRLMPHEIIRGPIGDEETRRKAEQDGILWTQLPTFYLDPGVAGQNIGAGGDSRLGHALFLINKNKFASRLESCIRDCYNYLKQQSEDKNHAVAGQAPAVHIVIMASLNGGIGSGSFDEQMYLAAELAEQLQVDIRLTPLLFCLGTLNSGDKKAAIRNQQFVLKNLLARLGNKFKDLHRPNNNYQIICDPPILVSNTNPRGEIPDLFRLQAYVANFLYLYCNTEFGHIFRQDCINLFDYKSRDQYGAARIGATIGGSAVNLDIEKLRKAATAQISFKFTSTLLENKPSLAAKRAAAGFTIVQSLKETNTEDSAVQSILALKNMGNMSAVDRAKNVLRHRCGSRWGFAGCGDIHHACKYALENEVYKNLLPTIEKQGYELINTIVENLKKEIDQYMTQKNGLSEATQFNEELTRLITKSASFNKQKLQQFKANNDSVKNTIASLENIFHRLTNKNRFWRFFSFSDKAKYKSQMPVYAAFHIENELQIFARTLLDEMVYPAIKRAVSEQQKRLNRTINNLILTSGNFKNEADRIKYLPDDLTVPVGIELADSFFIEKKTNEIIEDNDGEEKAISKIFEFFIGRFKSLDAFAIGDSVEISNSINDFCRQMTMRVVSRINLFDTINERFSDKQKQFEMVGQLIGQSSGRIKTSGEGRDTIPHKKYILGPNHKIVQWAVDIANEINRDGGDWNGIVEESLMGIHFAQYRAKVSLAQQIKDTLHIYTPPTDPKELVKIGENPILSIMPLPGCPDEQLNTVIAQAITANVITKPNHSYELIKSGYEPLSLGSLAEQIRQSMRKDHSVVTDIHEMFAFQLARNYSGLTKTISEYIAGKNDGQLAAELGEKAFSDTLEVAYALKPYITRMPLKR